MKVKRKRSMHLYDARKLVLALLRHNACPQNTMHGVLDEETVLALRVMLDRTIIRTTCGLCGKVMEN
jgi:hypothetical protein